MAEKSTLSPRPLRQPWQTPIKGGLCESGKVPTGRPGCVLLGWVYLGTRAFHAGFLEFFQRLRLRIQGQRAWIRRIGD